jgi:hypothetical protein
MECNKNAMEIINFNKFNDEINKYYLETKGEFQEFFSTCDTKDDNTKDDNTKDDNTKDDNTKDGNTKDDNTKDGIIKGGTGRNTKLNKYFFIILRCLIFSVFTNEIFRELIFILPPYLVNQISISFISLLKYIVINRCAAQIPILNDMCPAYKDLLIEFLNNLEIILIKLAPILKYGLGTIINSFAVRDIYNDSKIYYYLLNNPEFIDDIEYPENTEFIVNKNNYPIDFVQEINSAINGPTQTNIEGIATTFSTHKFIPKHIKQLKYLDRTILQDQGEAVEVDKFIAINDEYVYLNPIYTRFYINIGYLSVSYISEDQAKIEVNKYIKDSSEMKTILKLLELRLNFPEPFIRNLSHNLGYGYKSNIFKTIGYGDIPIGIKNLKQKRQEQWDALRVALLEERREKEEQENTSSFGGKLTKKKTRKSYKLVKKYRKSRKSYKLVKKIKNKK